MNSADSTILVKTESNKPEQCESCGAHFECGAMAQNCWCAKIELSDETRRDLQTNFARCLCRDCLENFGTSETSKAQERAEQMTKSLEGREHADGVALLREAREERS